jgi:hypothetical protein
MDRRQIQRLAAAQLTPSLFEELAAHGEDLLVERKSQIPEPERLGAEVASMANMLGGWILLGVNDTTHALESLRLPDGVDVQSHIGNLLRKAVDPVPPFLAGTLDIGEVRVGFIRVFEASVPVLVKGSGAVYSRDDGGKQPVSDHRALLDLAQRGRDAEIAAGKRAEENGLMREVLGLGNIGGDLNMHLQVTVRAVLLTVTPQVSEWPISGGPGSCTTTAQALAVDMGAPQRGQQMLRPFGRAVAAAVVPERRASLDAEKYETIAAADCAGIFGVCATWPVPNALKPDELRQQYIRPAINNVAEMLQEAEALGDALFDLHLIPRRRVGLMDGRGDFESHPLPNMVHCGSAIFSIPSDDEDRAGLAKRWEREVARTTGISAWEPGA